MTPEEIAVEAATLIQAAVFPHLGTFAARSKVGDAPGGDATLAIDEVAEDVLSTVLEAAGDIAFYSEDQGLVTFGRPRAVLIVDPVDGTRPAAAGLESCCVSIAVVPDVDSTLGEVSFGVVTELKSGRRFCVHELPVRRCCGRADRRRDRGCRHPLRRTVTRGPSGPRIGLGRGTRGPRCSHAGTPRCAARRRRRWNDPSRGLVGI